MICQYSTQIGDFSDDLSCLNKILNNSADVVDYTSEDDSFSLCIPLPIKQVSKIIKKPKHINKKRKTDVLVENGKVVQFEAGFPRPRVLRTDIRRSYANMYINAMNSNNFAMLFGFLDTFCNPSFTSSITREFVLFNEVKNVSTSRYGVAECAKFWCYNFFTIPDSVLILKNVDIITEDDETSRIVVTYTFKATKIFNCGAIWKEENDICNKHDESFHQCNCSIFDRKEDVIQCIQNSVNEKVKQLTVRPDPLPVSSEGIFTFYVNENKLLTRMELKSMASSENSQ